MNNEAAPRRSNQSAIEDYLSAQNRMMQGQIDQINKYLSLISGAPGTAPPGIELPPGTGISHASLIDVESDQHHDRYTDQEAIDAVGPIPPQIPQTYLHEDLTDVTSDQHHPELHDLDSHLDVEAGLPAAGEYLYFDGVNWVPRLSQSALGFVEFDYKYSANNDDTPTSGYIQYDNDDPALATVMYVHEEDKKGADRSLFWDELKDGDWLNLHDPDDVESRHQLFDVVGDVTKVGYTYHVPISLYEQAGGDFNNNYRITVYVRYVSGSAGSYLPLAGGTMSGQIDMGYNSIIGINSLRPISGQPLFIVDDAGIRRIRVNNVSQGSEIHFLNENGSTPILSLSPLGIVARLAMSMTDTKITDLADPGAPQDAATKLYVDTRTGEYLLLDGSSTMVGNLDMGNYRINRLTAPSASTDAANKAYVDGFLPLNGGTMAGQIDMDGNFIVGIDELRAAPSKNMALRDDQGVARIVVYSEDAAVTPSNVTFNDANGDTVAGWNETTQRWQFLTPVNKISVDNGSQAEPAIGFESLPGTGISLVNGNWMTFGSDGERVADILPDRFRTFKNTYVTVASDSTAAPNVYRNPSTGLLQNSTAAVMVGEPETHDQLEARMSGPVDTAALLLSILDRLDVLEDKIDRRSR